MDTFGNAILGMVFLALSFAGTFLMYKLWGYPFDEKTLKSSAPRPMMLLHRTIGYLYLVIYLYLMSQMLPRLWQYQVELPARTVAHLMLGMAIGVILLAKIVIVRFFKYLEGQMAPILGTGLLVCTTLLIGLSVPVALREHYLSRRAAGGPAFTPENLARVASLLPQAGFPEDVPLGSLAIPSALQQGRAVLLKKCVQCHDLRTVLVRPKTPGQWRETVARMAERAVLAEPLNEFEQRFVTAYLIAITPELQKSVMAIRQQEIKREETRAAIAAVTATLPGELAGAPAAAAFDHPAARSLFERTCSQCHSLSNVEKNPPANATEATALLDRMIDNGLEVTDEEFEQLVLYLTQTYGKN
ncbi:MAG: cytochrome c [candidate division KSB1 bacterium]|nr:cytochrome c [candidate division KSB1 bacterium]MDZ7409812.1 cytochrome c [candidate division KSB1 bacterium]